MEIIDEEGRLFGVVNVVDALVVLFVLAVGIAGVALVTGGPAEPQTSQMETRHVTLDLGTHPEYIADQVEIGDTDTLDGASGNVTITDAHFATSDSGIEGVVQAAVTRPANGEFTVDDEPLRLGRALQFENTSYALNTTVRGVGNESTLPTADRTVVLRGTVTSSVATDLRSERQIRVGGRQVATIEEVATYDAEEPERRTVFLNATLRTYLDGDTARFGGSNVAIGGTVSLPVGGTLFRGTIDHVGGGGTRTTADVLATDVVDVDTAHAISEGDNYTVAGRDIATVENVARYGTEEPDRNRVYVGLSVQTLGYGDVPRFGDNSPVREGASLPFRTMDYQFTGEIVRFGALHEPGESATRTVTLQMKNVSPERADSVSAGLTETNADQTIAEITNVDVQPAIVTLTSESGDIFEREHPVNEDVTLAAELSVRERDSGVRFKGRTLQEGTEITLDLGTTTVTATVVGLDGE